MIYIQVEEELATTIIVLLHTMLVKVELEEELPADYQQMQILEVVAGAILEPVAQASLSSASTRRSRHEIRNRN